MGNQSDGRFLNQHRTNKGCGVGSFNCRRELPPKTRKPVTRTQRIIHEFFFITIGPLNCTGAGDRYKWQPIWTPFVVSAKSFLSENRDQSQNEKKRYAHSFENVHNQQCKRLGERIGTSPVN
jgi:hypothetical protein